MDRNEFLLIIKKLGIAPKEAAELLSVDYRTVKRWMARGGQVPEPSEKALRAWLRLKQRGLPWRDDAVSLGFMDEQERAEQLSLGREHAMALDEILEKVRKRGGPAAPWKVDLERHFAELGSIQFSFYPLANGLFSPAFYTRSDIDPDIDRDWPLLEDAIACITNAYSEREMPPTSISIVSKSEANRRNLWKKHRVLEAAVKPMVSRPGWDAVEYVVHEPTGPEGDSLTVDVRPEIGMVRQTDLEAGLRAKATVEQATLIVRTS